MTTPATTPSFNKASPRRRIAAHAHTLMRLGLCFYLLLFPWGQAFREIGSSVAFTGLVAYYLLDWRGSSLSRFPLRWLLAVFWGFVLFKVFHSLHVHSGLYVLEHNFSKGPALLLAAMESVRSRRDLRLLAWLGMAMAFSHGLAASWSLIQEGIHKNKRFGNMFSLVLPLFFCLPALLPERWNGFTRWTTTLLAALPGLFFWAGTQARSGWLGLIAAAFGFAWMRWGWRRAALAGLLLAVGMFAYRPGVLTPEHVMEDARWEIWSVALMEFKAHPWLGVGMNAFEPAHKAMGYVFDPTIYPCPVPHPHDIYLQFLAEGGVVGLAVLLAFLLGLLVWSARRIRPHVAGPRPDAYWLMAAAFWSAYLGYLFTALTAHNFFRTWWLGLAMTMLGVTLGACMAGRDDNA